MADETRVPPPEKPEPSDMLPLPPDDVAPTEPPPPQGDRGMQALEPVGWEQGPAAEALALVTLERVRNLWRQADALQRRVLREVHDKQTAMRLLDMILNARNALTEGFENYEEAERMLNEVAYQLEYQKRVREWSNSIGLLLFGYEVIWMLILAGGLMLVGPGFLEQWAGRLGYTAEGQGMDSLSWFILGLRSVLWGGLGGATGALHALWRHIAVQRDFDRDHLLWYLASPLQGMALGAFAFAAVMAGLLSMIPGEDITIRSALAVFALAWVMGFQQNVVYNMVRRILRAIGLSSQDSQDSPLGASSAS